MLLAVALLPPLVPSTTITAPNRQIAARVTLDAGGHPRLGVDFHGRTLVAPSALGLVLKQGSLDEHLRVLTVTRRSSDGTYPVITGKTARARDHYNEATISLQETSRLRRRLNIVVRAYDDGVAFRYEVPRQPNLSRFQLKDEVTEFRPVGNPTAYAMPLPNFNTPYEEVYQPAPLKDLKRGGLIGFPLLMVYSNQMALALTEADLIDYGGLYVSPINGALQGRVSPRLDKSGLAVDASLPHQSPWRVMMIADRPERLVESNLIGNLNPPNAIRDTSWIHPGKTTFPWWNGYNVGDAPFVGGQNTATHKWYIDFCAAHHIPYHSLDGLDNIAWYGGTIVPYVNQDITKSIREIDLPEILRYAKSKGVKIRLWMNSAGARAHMKTAFPNYEKMGIEGVMLDFFDHDDQETVNFVHDAVALAAKCHLTITLHNLYKPTGLSRTYPNLMTLEAARNLEFDKWDPEGITPEHELTVPFVRMLAGPVDFHSGSFHNVRAADFKPVDKSPMTIGTRAHQLARYVVYDGALPMIADSPAVYNGQAGLSFLSEVPTTWDETRVLQGRVGEFLVMARRKGSTWYVGAMTNSKSRTLTVPLTFLSAGSYRLQTWTDNMQSPSPFVFQTSTTSRSNRLELKLDAAGGAVARFTK